MKTGQNKKKLVLKKISIAQLKDDKIKEIKDGLALIKGGDITQFPPPICCITRPPDFC